MHSLDSESLYLSAITLFELRLGVEAMPQGKRRRQIALWLDTDVPAEYFQRILSVDERVANEAAHLVARARAKGRNALEMDSLIAATARVYSMPVATLNRTDFLQLDVELVDF